MPKRAIGTRKSRHAIALRGVRSRFEKGIRPFAISSMPKRAIEQTGQSRFEKGVDLFCLS